MKIEKKIWRNSIATIVLATCKISVNETIETLIPVINKYIQANNLTPRRIDK